jgi:hypothetical protein
MMTSEGREGDSGKTSQLAVESDEVSEKKTYEVVAKWQLREQP